MWLSPRKSTSFVVICSRTMNPLHPNLITNGHSLAIDDSFKLLGVLFDQKLTFEKHIQSVVSGLAQKVKILRKCLSIYESHSILQSFFFSFNFPLFEYCAPVWSSATGTHLKLLDRSFNMVKFLLPEIRGDLAIVAFLGLCHFFLKSLIVFITLLGVEFLPLPFISLILDK